MRACRNRKATAQNKGGDEQPPMLKPDSKIYVAGHRGLAGSALVKRLREKGYRNIVTRTHAELDLTEQRAVREFFSAERPEHVLIAAGPAA